MLTLGADTPGIFQIPEVTGLPRPGGHRRRARATPQGARRRTEQGSRGHPPTTVRGPTRIPLHSPPPRPASRDRSPRSQAWPDGGTDKGTRTSGSRDLCVEGSPSVGGAQTRQAGHVPPPASPAHIALPLTTESTSSGSLCSEDDSGYGLQRCGFRGSLGPRLHIQGQGAGPAPVSGKHGPSLASELDSQLRQRPLRGREVNQPPL